MTLEFTTAEFKQLLLVAEIALDHSGDLSLREFMTEDEINDLSAKVCKYNANILRAETKKK